MSDLPLSRRQVLTASVAAGSAAMLGLSPQAQARVQDFAGDYPYPVQRTDEEWRAMLSEEEYRILRQGGTEPKRSSPLWKEMSPGTYSCRGCDQQLYSSEQKRKLRVGWVFFYHSEPNSVMLGYDPHPNYGSESNVAMIETHCARCGSHLGHLVYLRGDILHCINGTSLVFKPQAA
ncbi:MAG: peptide-methionine (R)-S-oxide reductase [Rhodothalassiaceae bacterium]